MSATYWNGPFNRLPPLVGRRPNLVSTERGLSKRETTVFMLMASGCDIAAISDELFISKSAVRAHASRIYAKFAVHNRQEFNEVLDAYLPPLPEEEPSGS